MSLQLSESDIHNPEVLGEKLMILAEIVISRHFYASGYLFDDLKSVGILKALSMIQEGHYDKRKGNFASFLYSGIRNSIHNFLYHENKRDIVPIDSLINQGKSDDYFTEDERVYISYSLIHSVCIPFMKSFGESVEYQVISTLEDMGYTIQGRKSKDLPAFNYVYNLIEEEYGEEAEKDIISRIIGIIMWKRKDYELKAS